MARPRAEQPALRLVKRGRRFYVRWWRNGRWHRVSTGSEDRREAQRYLNQLAAGLATPAPPPSPTIAVILERYLAERKDQVASHDTLRFAAAALTRHLGDLQPGHLTTERCRFYARRRRAEGHEVGPPTARRRKPVGNGTIIRELVTLRAAFRLALHEHWIAAEPHVEVPKTPRPRDRWLTREEAARLIESAGLPHIRLFLLLALHTAARRGAILALHWDAVDLDRRLAADRPRRRHRQQGAGRRADQRRAAAGAGRGARGRDRGARHRARRQGGRQRRHRHPGGGPAGGAARRHASRAAPHGRDLDGAAGRAHARHRPVPWPQDHGHHGGDLRQALAGVAARGGRRAHHPLRPGDSLGPTGAPTTAGRASRNRSRAKDEAVKHTSGGLEAFGQAAFTDERLDERGRPELAHLDQDGFALQEHDVQP